MMDDALLQAMRTAFSLLEASRALGDKASSECSTAILFLSDGTITSGLGIDDPSEVSALVETLNADVGAEIFTFALGPEADAVSAGKVILRGARTVVAHVMVPSGWDQLFVSGTVGAINVRQKSSPPSETCILFHNSRASQLRSAR